MAKKIVTEKKSLNENLIRKIITGVLVFGYIIVGLIDLLMQGQGSYSSIMGMDIQRVIFYTFFMLTIGCWLLYHKWFVGIGFLSLAAFNSYFIEYLYIHNYFASVIIYLGMVVDILVRRKPKWLIPLVIVGIIQGVVFQTRILSHI
ncbi:MAG: hypothetical protein LBV20_01960, partial [Treponema sp.]|nr:hypothetical protein [Treponema sp.]